MFISDMGLKKILRKMRLLRTIYYKCQFKKDIKNIPQDIYQNSSAEILKLKGAYQGKRCFIIGNGLSLKAADLTPKRCVSP